MRAALGLLTIVGGGRAPSPTATAWFPAIGLAVGAVVGGVWWLAAGIWPHPVAAAVAVTADLVLTGALHFDGLGDAADGLLPHMERSRRLEVMRDPRAGTFAVVMVVTVLLLRWSVLATTPTDVAAVAILWCWSRTVMAVTMGAVPYARSSGLATGFGGGTVALPLAVGVVLCAAVAATSHPTVHVAALGAASLAAAAVVALARARVGGYTGDILGAAGVMAETVGLLTVAALR